MNARTVLWIALVVSVALNIFAAANLATGWLTVRSAEVAAADGQRPPRGGPMMAVVEDLDPQVRDQVREALRQSALAARPDFDQARQARREATAMAGAQTWDAAAVAALLQRSREAEMRGRTRLEGDSVDILGGLSLEDRQALAPVLTRKHHRGSRNREAQPDVPPEAARDQAARDSG